MFISTSLIFRPSLRMILQGMGFTSTIVGLRKSVASLTDSSELLRFIHPHRMKKSLLRWIHHPPLLPYRTRISDPLANPIHKFCLKLPLQSLSKTATPLLPLHTNLDNVPWSLDFSRHLLHSFHLHHHHCQLFLLLLRFRETCQFSTLPIIVLNLLNFIRFKFSWKQSTISRQSKWFGEVVHGKRRFFDHVNSNKSDHMSPKHADINQYDFVCLSETWDCSPTAVLRGFIFSPASREGRNRGRPSGGLEIYSNPSFSVEKKSISLNHLAITVNNFIAIIFIYYQPDFDFSLMIEDLSKALQSSGSYPIILAGDFNLHFDESDFDELSKFLSSLNIVLCSDPNETTFMHLNGGTSTPDFIFSSQSLLSAEHKTAVHDNIDSDHFPLSFILKSSSVCQLDSHHKYKLDTDKCSNLLKHNLHSLENLVPEETVTSLNKIFQDSLTKIRSPHTQPARWTSPEIKNTKKIAKFHLKKFQESSDDEDKKNFMQARNKVSRLIKKAKREFRLNETNNMILAGRAKGLAALYKYAKPFYNNISTQISIDDWKKLYTNLFQSHDRSLFSSGFLSPFPICFVFNITRLL